MVDWVKAVLKACEKATIRMRIIGKIYSVLTEDEIKEFWEMWDDYANFKLILAGVSMLEAELAKRKERGGEK